MTKEREELKKMIIDIQDKAELERLRKEKKILKRVVYTGAVVLVGALTIWGINSLPKKSIESPLQEVVKSTPLPVVEITEINEPRLSEEQLAQMSPLERMMHTDFGNPISLEIVNDPRRNVPIAYVFDAKDWSLHKFFNNNGTNFNTSLVAIGKYTSPSLTPKEPPPGRRNFLIGHDYKGYDKISVDNGDGTITIYKDALKLTFQERITPTEFLGWFSPRGELLCDYVKSAVGPYLKTNFGNMLSNSGTVNSSNNPPKNITNLIMKCLNGLIWEEGKHRVGIDDINHRISAYLDECFHLNYGLAKSCNAAESDDIIAPDFAPALAQHILKKVANDKPTHYHLFNDKPSRFEINFNHVIALWDYSVTNNGQCTVLPILGFDDSKEEIMFGYLCDNGEVEQHQRIPYSNVKITTPTEKTILDTAVYSNSVYLIQKGTSRIKRVELIEPMEK